MKAAALEIQKILKLMYGDISLWLELADIHMNLGDYQVLISCMSPMSIYFTIKKWSKLMSFRTHVLLFM